MAAGANNTDRDNETLVAIGLSVVAIFLVLAFFGDDLAYAVLQFARWHLIPTAALYPPHAEAVARIETISPDEAAEIGLMGAFGVANSALRVYGVILGLVAAVFGIRYLRSNPHRFDQRHDALSLLERNARIWPSMQPIVGLDLLNEPRETGPWRVADDYIRLCLRHRLIERRATHPMKPDIAPGDWVPVFRLERRGRKHLVAKAVTHADHYPRESVTARHFRLNPEATRAVLVDQLGEPLFRDGRFNLSRWTEWPLQHRALLAALLPIAFGPGQRVGRNFGLAMLNRYNASFYYPDYRRTGKPPIRLADLDQRGINPILARYLGLRYERPRPNEVLGSPIPAPASGAKAVRRFLRRHAWLNVAMLAVLLHARRRGTLITPDFIWLRPVDRTLFYTLNSAGRQNINHATPFPEACGVFAHYFVEDTLGAAVIDPDIETARVGLEADLIEEGWLAKPPREGPARSSRMGV